MAKKVTAAAPARRGRGRPRTSAPGSKPVFTTLGPEINAQVEELAARERRSVSATVAVLVEEGLKAREKSR